MSTPHDPFAFDAEFGDPNGCHSCRGAGKEMVSLLTALEDPSPAGPPVAPPAVVADALPEPEPCELSRAPRAAQLVALDGVGGASPSPSTSATSASARLCQR